MLLIYLSQVLPPALFSAWTLTELVASFLWVLSLADPCCSLASSRVSGSTSCCSWLDYWGGPWTWFITSLFLGLSIDLVISTLLCPPCSDMVGWCPGWWEHCAMITVGFSLIFPFIAALLSLHSNVNIHHYIYFSYKVQGASACKMHTKECLAMFLFLFLLQKKCW